MNKRRQALKRRIRRNKDRSGKVPLAQCGLYGFRSLSPLASVLWQSNAGLRALAERPTYVQWVEKKPGKKDRHIQDPRGDTEKVHYRIYELLDRVRRPDFLHSATRRRSCITNAARHIGVAPTVATDMKGCYEATSIFRVQGFFEHDLRIAPDLAWKLARICCIRGHLPTGSCLSPLLAYWANRQAFDDIAAMCDAAGITMTLYVDDLTFSGDHASLAFLHQVKARLAEVGLVTHKDKSFARGRVKHVTGVAVTVRGLRVPNKRLKEIVDKIARLAETPPEKRKALSNSIAGSIGSAAAISKRVGTSLRGRRDRHIGRAEASTLSNPTLFREAASSLAMDESDPDSLPF